MRSDIDIKDDLYKFIKGSELESMVSGVLSKTLRPNRSGKEDIVISVLANENGQIQEAYVNVNIYVSDLLRNGQYEEDSSRLRELCAASSSLLLVGRGGCFRFELESQRVFAVEATNEHVINNRLLYRNCNE